MRHLTYVESCTSEHRELYGDGIYTVYREKEVDISRTGNTVLGETKLERENEEPVTEETIPISPCKSRIGRHYT